MDKEMIAFCGTYCGICEWKDRIGCKGCKTQGGDMFWGECDKAKCCIGRGFTHCGECADMPCQMLLKLFDDPEHGDKGARLRNLQNWKNETYVYEKLNNAAQEQAKKIVLDL
uniref:DUF3795 domain-containing protein n=1 Tax=Candidatus Fimivicinus sp. TaxID=3056640 RepID=UPI003FF11CED